MAEVLSSNRVYFRKDTVYNWVFGFGIISLPFLFLASILLLYNIKAKTGKYKLILLLAVSTFFCTLSYILPWEEHKKEDPPSTLCYIQGNLMVMFETSQYLISMLVGYHTRFVILFNNGSDTGFKKSRLFAYGFVGFGIPLILLIIANMLDRIGYCSPWCWILDKEDEVDYFYRILTYSLMIGSQLLNICFSLSIIAHLNNDPYISEEQKKRHTSLIYKMLRYPICLLICIAPGLINRISSLGESRSDDDKGMTFLSSLATIMLTSSGFVILFMYGLTLNAFRLLKESCNKTVNPDEDYYATSNEIAEITDGD